jgi:hypothetical protein
MRYKLIITSFFLAIAIISCKKDDDPQKNAEDKTGMLVGSWGLIETNDPDGLPTELIYTFEENGAFSLRLTQPSGARAATVLDGTWRFTNDEQSLLEISIDGVSTRVFDINELTLSTLRITSDGITEVFSKR